MVGGCFSIGNLNYEYLLFVIWGVIVKYICLDFILFLKCILLIYSLLFYC